MIDNYIRQANQHLSAGKIDEALSLYRQAIKKNPGFCWHHHYLGESLAKSGNWEAAVAAYETALELNPSSAWSHYRLGEAFAALGKAEEALASYSQAVELSPDFSVFQKTLADAMTRKGETKNAGLAYSKSLELQPNQAEVERKLYDLARTHLLAQEYDLAIKNCLGIIGTNTRLADIFSVLGRAYTLKEKHEAGAAFLNVIPYMRHLVARQTVERLWGSVVENIPQDLGNSELGKSQDVNKIVIYTCVWQRPKLTEVVLSHYSHLKNQLSGKIKLELLAVGSEGETSQQLCESCGFDYLEFPNLPLSAKWEYGLNRCADYDPDAVIIVGSDDIISQGLIEFYDRKLREGLVFGGLKDVYFFDTISQEMILWKGYQKLDIRRFGETIGMARCFARPLLDKLKFSVWKGLKINKRLDRIVTEKLLDLGLHFLDYDYLVFAEIGQKYLRLGHCGFYMGQVDAFAVDIKTIENITPFNLLTQNKDAILYEKSPWEMMAKYLPNSTVEGIKTMGKGCEENG